MEEQRNTGRCRFVPHELLHQWEEHSDSRILVTHTSLTRGMNLPTPGILVTLSACDMKKHDFPYVMKCPRETCRKPCVDEPPCCQWVPTDLSTGDRRVLAG